VSPGLPDSAAPHWVVAALDGYVLQAPARAPPGRFGWVWPGRRRRWFGLRGL